MIELYHGSPHKFEQFSFEKIGSESGVIGAGFGIYFADEKSDALCYGDIVYTCHVELTNNLSNEKVTLSKAVLGAIIDKIETVTTKDYYFELHPDEDRDMVLNRLINNSDSDTYIVGMLIEKLFDGSPEDVRTVLDIFVDYGYNHTIDNDTPDANYITHYIVYDLDAIRIIKNETLNDI